MNVTSLLSIALGAILTNNFILVKFLGICPFMGVSKKTDTALGMGVAVTFVMALASMVTWAVDHYILTPLDLGYMQTAAFILIIAAIGAGGGDVPEKERTHPVPGPGHIPAPHHHQLQPCWAVALLNIQEHYNFLESLVYGFTGGLGFILAIVLFSAVRQRVEEAECPESFQGFPIALISAGLLALAFMGFSGSKSFKEARQMDCSNKIAWQGRPGWFSAFFGLVIAVANRVFYVQRHPA